MKKICLTLLILITSFAAFGADQISVTINGQSYVCTGAAASEPQVVSVYCECSETAGIYLKRMAIMSNGTSKTVSVTQLTPSNGSYNPQEVREKCQLLQRQCSK